MKRKIPIVLLIILFMNLLPSVFNVANVEAGFIATDLNRLTNDPRAEYSAMISGDGSKIAFELKLNAGTTEIFVMNYDGSELTQLTNNTVNDSYPSINYDGSKIAFASQVDGIYQIFLINSNGTGLTQLTNSTETCWDPDISADGSKITFVCGYVYSNIYIVDTDGSNLTQLSTGFYAQDNPSINGDGTKIVYNEGSGICTVNSDGSDQLNLNVTGDYAIINYDGSRITFASDWDIFVINSDGTELTQLTNTENNNSPVICGDGTKIAYISTEDDYYEIFVIDVNTTFSYQLTHNEENVHVYAPKINYDGNRIVYRSLAPGDTYSEIFLLDFAYVPDYNLSINTIGLGETIPNTGIHNYIEDTNVTIRAFPNQGWVLAQWILDGINIGLENPITITMDTHHNLTAVFEEKSTLIIEVNGLGTTSPSVGAYGLPQNNFVEILAMPEIGWYFSHWLLDNSSIGSANPITVEINQDHKLVAVFEEISILDWDISLIASLADYSDSSELGVRADATNQFDPSYDQIDPVPPPEGIVSYFYYPENPSSPVNLQKLSTSKISPEPVMNWTYNITPVGLSGEVTLGWNPSQIGGIPPDRAIYLVCPDQSRISMRTYSSYEFVAEADTTYSFEIIVGLVEDNLILSPGWNMISFSSIPENNSFSSIFGELSYFQVLTWDGFSYVTPSFAEAGVGYWVLALEDANITVGDAAPVTGFVAELDAGWSMVGSVYGVAVDAPSLFSSFYQLLSWDGASYISSSTFESCRGYWVLVLEQTNVTVEVEAGQDSSGSGANFDSGWIDLRGLLGNSFILSHNLNSDDLLVDITGRETLGSEIHQKYLGLSYIPGWFRPQGTSDPETLIKTNDNGFAILSSNSLDLRKTDSQGNIQWSNDYTGTTNCEGKSVIQTNDGGYAILANKALYLSQFGNTYDIVLIKTDEDGNEIWRQTYKETDVNFYDVEFGFSIIQTNDEGFIIAGYKQEVRYNGYEYSVGDENFLLIETDANGNEIWNKTYDKFNSTDMATSIVSTVDGGYTIAGYTQDLNETHYVRLLKIDSVGNIDWERMFEIEEQVFPSVVTTSDGGYAFIDGSRLIKTDAIGNQKWGKQYNFSFSILTSTINNGFALANVDGRLLITDMDGNLLGSDTVVPYLRSIVQASDGGFVVLSTGHFYNDQPVLIKTNVETGLANVSLDENSITLYRGLNDIYWNYVRVRIWRTD